MARKNNSPTYTLNDAMDFVRQLGNTDYVLQSEGEQRQYDREEQPEPLPEKPQGYFSELIDNFGKAINTNQANYNEIDMGRRQGQILQRLNDGDYANEGEYQALKDEYKQLDNDRAYQNKLYQRNQDILTDRGSFQANLTQMGGTLHGARQSLTGGAIGAGIGAFAGSIIPAAGTAVGAKTGWDVGRYMGGLYGADYEARSNADDARVKVLQEGGSTDQAQAAWERAYHTNLVTTVPEALAMQYIGGKAVNTLGSKIPKVNIAMNKIDQSAFGKALGLVNKFDPVTSMADAVAKGTGSAIAGRVAGVGGAMLGSAIGEGIQEPTQDYLTEGTVNEQRANYAPDKYNPDYYGLQGAKDFYSRPEEIETAKQAAISGAFMTGLFGSIGSKGFLSKHLNETSKIKFGNNIQDFIKNNPDLTVNQANLNQMQEQIARVADISPEEAHSLSVEDTVRMARDLYGEMLGGKEGAIKESYTKAENEIINHLFDGQEQSAPSLMSDASKKFFDTYGGFDEGVGLYSPSERQQEEQQTVQQQEQQTAEEERQQEEAVKQTTVDSNTDQTAVAQITQDRLNKINVVKTAVGSLKAQYDMAMSNGQIRKARRIMQDLGKANRRLNKLSAGSNTTQQGQAITTKSPHNIFTNETAEQVKERKANENATVEQNSNPIEENDNTYADTLGGWNKGQQVEDVQTKGQVYTNDKGESVLFTRNNDGTVDVGSTDGKTTRVFDNEDQANKWMMSGESPKYSEQSIGNVNDTNGDGTDLNNIKGIKVHSVQELNGYYDKYKGTDKELSPMQYFYLSDMLMRTKNASPTLNFALDQKAINPENGNQVYGSMENVVENGLNKAILSLYKGADVVTAVHEFAHAGWALMSNQDKQNFAKYAVQSEADFICKVFGIENSKENIAKVMEGKNGSFKELYDKSGIARQTFDLMNKNMSDDVRKRATEERFCHEFSLWYVDGMTSGATPSGIVRMFMSVARSLGKGLQKLGFTAEWLKSDGYKNLKLKTSPMTMFENINKLDNKVDQTNNTNTAPNVLIDPKVNVVNRYAPNVGSEQLRLGSPANFVAGKDGISQVQRGVIDDSNNTSGRQIEVNYNGRPIRSAEIINEKNQKQDNTSNGVVPSEPQNKVTEQAKVKEIEKQIDKKKKTEKKVKQLKEKVAKLPKEKQTKVEKKIEKVAKNPNGSNQEVAKQYVKEKETPKPTQKSNPLEGYVIDNGKGGTTEVHLATQQPEVKEVSTDTEPQEKTFTCYVKDKDTGEKKLIETKSKSKAQVMEDLSANGYTAYKVAEKGWYDAWFKFSGGDNDWDFAALKYFKNKPPQTQEEWNSAVERLSKELDERHKKNDIKREEKNKQHEQEFKQQREQNIKDDIDRLEKLSKEKRLLALETRRDSIEKNSSDLYTEDIKVVLDYFKNDVAELDNKEEEEQKEIDKERDKEIAIYNGEIPDENMDGKGEAEDEINHIKGITRIADKESELQEFIDNYKDYDGSMKKFVTKVLKAFPKEVKVLKNGGHLTEENTIKETPKQPAKKQTQQTVKTYPDIEKQVTAQEQKEIWQKKIRGITSEYGLTKEQQGEVMDKFGGRKLDTILDMERDKLQNRYTEDIDKLKKLENKITKLDNNPAIKNDTALQEKRLEYAKKHYESKLSARAVKVLQADNAYVSKIAGKHLSEQGGETISSNEDMKGSVDKFSGVWRVQFDKRATGFDKNKQIISQLKKNSKEWKEIKYAGGAVAYERIKKEKGHTSVISYTNLNGIERTESKKQWAKKVADLVVRKMFNEDDPLRKMAIESGRFDDYMKMVVEKEQGSVANSAILDGIVLPDGKTRTASLLDIYNSIPQVDREEFNNYAIAKHTVELAKNGIKQPMTEQEAIKIINDVEKGKNSALWKDTQKKLVEYNQALLDVLVDGNLITKGTKDMLLKKYPNYIPLEKKIEDIDTGEYVTRLASGKKIVNIVAPLKKIKGSSREVLDPIQITARHAEKFYSDASRNKAGLTFVTGVAQAISLDNNGEKVRLNGSLLKELVGKDLKADAKKHIFFVTDIQSVKDNKTGKTYEKAVKRFFQVSDQQIYNALISFTPDQISTAWKLASKPASLIRDTATAVPDFFIRNVIRDNAEAFLSTEHGFLPIIDAVWGAKQILQDTNWWKEYQSMNGEFNTLTKDEKGLPSLTRKQKTKDLWNTFTDNKVSAKNRMSAFAKLFARPASLLKNRLEQINNLGELATRVGEYKNARMGYDGTWGRLTSGDMFGSNMSKAKNDKYFASYKAKEITLNFGQHGEWGKKINRVLPFFNATMQGTYKTIKMFDDVVNGSTGKQRRYELGLKMALTAMGAVAVFGLGHGNRDYDDAPEYEWQNFWILPNGFRIPKDQCFGTSIGTTVEMMCRQWENDKKLDPAKLVTSFLGSYTPQNILPTIAVLGLGIGVNKDTFKNTDIVPEYLQGKHGFQQVDVNTSNLAKDISSFLYTNFKQDVSAKKLDWGFQTMLSNFNKYLQSGYDISRELATGTKNTKMARGGDLGFLKDDVPRPLNLVTGTFVTNATSFQPVSDFYDKYKELQKFVDKSNKNNPKIEKDSNGNPLIDMKEWKRYEQANKEMKNLNKQLRAIKADTSLDPKEKRKLADPLFNKQIKLAKWAKNN